MHFVLEIRPNYYQASFPKNAIFQDIEHLNDFQTIRHGGQFVFQIEAKFFHRQKMHSRMSHGLFLHSKAKGQIQHFEKIIR